MIKLFIAESIILAGFFVYSFNQVCKNSGIRKSIYRTQIFSQYTKNPVIINGRLDDINWWYAESITIFDSLNRSADSALIRTAWDTQNLYIAFEVKDKDLQAKQTVQDHPLLSQDDIAEFLIDTHNTKDSCWNTGDIVYHINLLGQKKDDRGTSTCKSDAKWNGNAKYAVHLAGTLNNSNDIDSGYIVEVAISWKELKIKPFAGLEIGIDFAIGDSGIFFDWAGTSPFRSPNAYGNLVLKK